MPVRCWLPCFGGLYIGARADAEEVCSVSLSSIFSLLFALAHSFVRPLQTSAVEVALGNDPSCTGAPIEKRMRLRTVKTWATNREQAVAVDADAESPTRYVQQPSTSPDLKNSERQTRP